MDKLPGNPAEGKEPRKKPPRSYAVIDQKGCTGCHSCIPVCPVDCIEQVPGPDYPDFMRLVEVDLERCIGCEACAKICPWDTIFMLKPEETEQTAKDWTIRTVLYKEIADPPKGDPEAA